VTSCPDCTEAARRTWGGYTARCPGCAARAIARSQTAFHAYTRGTEDDKEEMRHLIAKLMPRTSTTEARRLVHGWWQADHPTTESKTA
jgi:hypothetical protein